MAPLVPDSADRSLSHDALVTCVLSALVDPGGGEAHAPPPRAGFLAHLAYYAKEPIAS